MLSTTSIKPEQLVTATIPDRLRRRARHLIDTLGTLFSDPTAPDEDAAKWRGYLNDLKEACSAVLKSALRDQFATAALSVLAKSDHDIHESPLCVAHHAYRIADAIMAKREMAVSFWQACMMWHSVSC